MHITRYPAQPMLAWKGMKAPQDQIQRLKLLLGLNKIYGVGGDRGKRKRFSQQSKNNEARFQALVETSPDGIIEVGADGIIMYANARYLRLVGATEAGQVIGQKVLKFVHPDYHHLVQERLSNSGEIPFIEEKYVRLDGGIIPVEVGAARLEGSGNSGAKVMAIVRDISERKSQQSTIQRLSYHDPITNLPNRRMLREQATMILAQNGRSGQQSALVYLDLDHFKEINDTLGHQAGDELLARVGQRIQACVREGDVLARLGGDEFAIMLQDISVEEAADVATRVISALQNPFTVADATLQVEASMGIGLYPRDGSNLNELMRVADVAMYRAKENGGGFMFYSPELDRYSRERLQMLYDLRVGIEQNQIVLEYQPILDTNSGQWSKLEALARWLHPKRGLIAPGEFIPLAEESGLIRELDRKILEKACLEASSHGLPIAVNISARTLYDPSFVQTVKTALLQSNLAADHLYLEITETALIQDLPRAIQYLNAVRNLGVHIALDDFGVGNSSMGYLKDLPIDIIKIDRSFISGVGKNHREEALLQAILSLGEGLGLPTVAEGVETTEQMEWLTNRGCSLLQGFGIARPQSREKILSQTQMVALV